MKGFAWTLMAAGLVAGCVQQTPQRASSTASQAGASQAGAPSQSFDLANWKLTLPVDEEGEAGGDEAAEVESLAGYVNPQYFFRTADGAMVFVAGVDGATTGGSRYPRSELREMRGEERAAWTLAEGGTMTATLAVNSVPTRDDGSPGRLIVGQIHGEDEELIRLYYEDSSVHFVNDQAGDDDEETSFTLENANGEEPDIGLNERFSYLIDARGDVLTVEVHADGQVYRSATEINDVWQSDTFYFKAGVYLGVNEESGSGVGRVSFYDLDFSHAPGGGRGGLS
jgi:hypothetical protein